MFTGRYDRQLDPKGRLALPAEFRRRFDSQALCALGENGCIDVFTPEDFERRVDELMEKVRTGERHRNELRALTSNAYGAAIDGQGRISVQPRLRDYAGLELSSTVTVAGAWDRIEIWNTPAFEAVEEAGTAGIRGV